MTNTAVVKCTIAVLSLCAKYTTNSSPVIFITAFDSHLVQKAFIYAGFRVAKWLQVHCNSTNLECSQVFLSKNKKSLKATD